jgi:predicted AlkP superfamily pyrophosphatase or phosphodiesterase
VHPDFVKPRYGSHCFADIPPTVRYLLTGVGAPALAPDVLQPFHRRYETVILFLIDTFGWRYLERYGATYPFLHRLTHDGHVSKLTAQFPSTTAAQVTTLHTGLPVGQSGTYEWHYFEPQVDAIITPLLFSYVGTTARDTLKPTHMAPASFFPSTTFYQSLARYGVQSTIVQHRDYTPSTYSNVVFQGARVVPYTTLSEALVNLQALLAEQTTPAYYVLYFDTIDALAHQYGPHSPQVEAELDTFLTTMERLFDPKRHRQRSPMLFVMTADHGQIDTDPKTTLYLNLEPRFAGLERYLKTNGKDELLVPAGSARDMFLYVKDDCLDEVHQFLAERLAGKAEVVKTQWLIEAGYFGPPPVSDRLLTRVGNLVILPHKYETVWWYEKGKFAQKFYGHHGGLTREEMDIPLCLYDWSA